MSAAAGIGMFATVASLATFAPGSAPTVGSVFDHVPCQPDPPFPFREGLRLTIQSRSQEPAAPTKPLNTIQELFDAFEACWAPPPLDRARPGTEITIRFSLNRAGEIIGEPRFTYSTRDLPSEVKSAYQRAIADAIRRCTPFPLSDELGGAIAGRPISTRFIDNRGFRRTENAHER